MLRGEQVEKHFEGVTALAGVDIEVREGEILGLIGPNGSGKTTLLNVVSGVYVPTGGRILLGEDDIAGRKAHQVAVVGDLPHVPEHQALHPAHRQRERRGGRRSRHRRSRRSTRCSRVGPARHRAREGRQPPLRHAAPARDRTSGRPAALVDPARRTGRRDERIRVRRPAREHPKDPVGPGVLGRRRRPRPAPDHEAVRPHPGPGPGTDDRRGSPAKRSRRTLR